MTERLTTWKGPTGRTLEGGRTEFKIQGKRGRFLFLALVTPTRGEQYVEAMDDRRRTRCFAPEAVHTVSTKPREGR